MEALALLCTLHADGPATLRRLRRAGCGSLEQLEAYEPEHLASLLEIPPAVARRLGKEARVLANRLDPVFEDREEGGEQDGALTGSKDEALSSRSAGAIDPSEEVGGHLDLRDRRILGAVLDRWSATPSSDAPSESEHEAAPSPVMIQGLPEPPQAVEVVEPGGLLAGCIDGLDDETAAALTELGISDLGSLAEQETLPLAHDLGVPFAQVRRLQFLARQAVRLEESEIPAVPEALPRPDAVDLVPAPLRSIAPPPEPVIEPFRETAPEALAPTELEPAGMEPALEEPIAPEPEAEAREPRRFWEPRPFLGGQDEVADPVPLPDESEERALREGRVPRREGVTLDWRFEVPRPPLRPEPEREQEIESAESARLLEGDARPLHEDTDAAGPFA